jgi:hypothetical protein
MTDIKVRYERQRSARLTPTMIAAKIACPPHRKKSAQMSRYREI